MHSESISHRAWKDSQNWLLGSFVAWILLFLVTVGAGVLVAIFIPQNASTTIQAIYFAIGAIIAFVVFILVTYLIHFPISLRSQRNDARKHIQELELEINRKKNPLELAAFIPEGENIKNLCYNEWDREPKKEAEEWAERVATFLDSLGTHYRPSFYSDDGLGSPNIKPQWTSREHREVATFVSHRLMRINEFLAELRKK